MDKISPLLTAAATAIGGRNGHTESSDGAIKADLSLPEALGGQGKPGLATPEHFSLRAMLPALVERSTSLQNKRSAMPQKPRLPVPSRSARVRPAALASR